MKAKPKKRREPPMRVRLDSKKVRKPKAHHRYLAGLRSVRLAKRLRQEDLARLSGISRITISHLEWQDQRAHPKTMRKLSDALGVHPEVLTTDPGEEEVRAS